jgi:hypothetical protein
MQAENGAGRRLGCRRECSAGRVRLTMDGKLLLDSVPLEAGLGFVEC